jgi:hypothetical protein
MIVVLVCFVVLITRKLNTREQSIFAKRALCAQPVADRVRHHTADKSNECIASQFLASLSYQSHQKTSHIKHHTLTWRRFGYALLQLVVRAEEGEMTHPRRRCSAQRAVVQHLCVRQLADARSVGRDARTPTPPVRLFACSFWKPFAPSTCMIVFTASIGIKAIRNDAAANDAVMLRKTVGTPCREGACSKTDSTPALAAVSPNRDNGAWKSAAPRPR